MGGVGGRGGSQARAGPAWPVRRWRPVRLANRPPGGEEAVASDLGKKADQARPWQLHQWGSGT